MNLGEARTAVRSATDHDSDTQVTDAQLNAWINQEYTNLRQRLAHLAPYKYTTVSGTQTITAGGTLTRPADLIAMVRLERQAQGGETWFPVDVSDEHAPDDSELNWRLEGTVIRLSPAADAAGTYRFVYVQDATSLSADGDTINAPGCMLDVIVHGVAARVRERLDEDPSPHLRRAQATWEENKRSLSRPYGNHPRPGLRRTRRSMWWG